MQKIQLNNFDPKNITYITDIDQIQEQNFKNETLIGVDIEHTKALGFDGKISLIQLKTSQGIYIIDTILIQQRDRLKNLLEMIFQNDGIKTVFYRGIQDCIWLSRDFEINVKNYQDICDIAEAIDRKNDNSLIGLWKKYCQIDFAKDDKKKLQTSDWNKRPLSQEQLFYAAQDCAYLDYLWGVLMQELVEKVPPEDISKLQSKFQKPKFYTLERKNRYQHLQYAIQNLDNLLDHFSDYYNNDYYDDLDITDIALIRFIFTDLCDSRQEYAILHDVPIQSLSTDDYLLKASIVLYEQIELKDIDYMEYYKELENYENSIYLNSKKKLNKELSYNEWQSIICNGFMNALQLDLNFVKWVLTEIYNTLLFKTNQKVVEKQKIAEKNERSLKFNTSKKPIFGDCQLLAPDNMVLCNTDRKKANWYLKNNKAVLIQEDPMIIKLNFQPSGYETYKESGEIDTNQKQYMTTIKENQCVVCSSKQNYKKYNIIPPTYKTHFPEKFKSMKNHGFVLLCSKCHDKANTTADQMKDKIAQDFNVPIQIFDESSLVIKKVNQLQKQLISYQTKITNCTVEVQKKFKLQLRQFWEEILKFEYLKEFEDLIQINKTKSNKVKVDDSFKHTLEKLIELLQNNSLCEKSKNIHGQKVVEKLKTDQDYLDFINLWRNHFLNSMEPKYLPDSWYVDGKPKGQQQIFFTEGQVQVE